MARHHCDKCGKYADLIIWQVFGLCEDCMRELFRRAARGVK